LEGVSVVVVGRWEGSSLLQFIFRFCVCSSSAQSFVSIIVDFCKTYGSRLHSLIKLQGIQEESQERTVACLPSWNVGKQARLYLRAGWSDFAAENNLKVGQVIVFTLTADSFFVVRGVVPSSRENIAGQGRV
jgi:hypothetical protein